MILYPVPISTCDQEELSAAYERIEELEGALKIARKHLETLGGDPREDEFGDTIQSAILNAVDEVLSC